MLNSRNSLAEFIDCDSESLVFFQNPTTAINEIIRSLKLNKGDEVLSTDHEYGAMDKAWEFITEKTGSHYKRLELPFPIDSKDDIISIIKNNFSFVK